jgi:hypothetical protein
MTNYDSEAELLSLSAKLDDDIKASQQRSAAALAEMEAELRGLRQQVPSPSPVDACVRELEAKVVELRREFTKECREIAQESMHREQVDAS